MKRRKKNILWTLGILVILLIFFLTWYKLTYSMEPAETYEINDEKAPYHVLIATQGSNFKDLLVNQLIIELETRPVYVRVIDVSALSQIKEAEWMAIVVLHTWEYARPEQNAKDFIDRIRDRKKLIVLSTSGSGNNLIEGVDGITSASRPSEVPIKVNEIMTRVTKLLSPE